MKIKVNASLSKEELLAYGEYAGLAGEALDFFKYFNEIEIDLFVDAENGLVTGAEITQQF